MGEIYLELSSKSSGGTQLPEKFLQIDDSEQFGKTDDEKIKYVKKLIIKQTENFNKHIKITDIVFDKTNIVAGVNRTISQSRLYNQIKIDTNQKKYYEDLNYEVFEKEKDKEFYANEILAFVQHSSMTEQGRNTTIAQDVFPIMAEYMNLTLEHPNYYYANLPMYYIHLVNKEYSADTIQSNLLILKLMGVFIIDVFEKNLSLLKKDFNYFIKKFCEQSKTDKNIFFHKYYTIDVDKKTITINNPMQASILTNNAFHGSRDKEYFLQITGISIVGYNNGYKIIATNLYNFINTNSSLTGKKRSYLESCINYIKKYIGEED